jgi:DNA polymerase-3 subunit delta
MLMKTIDADIKSRSFSPTYLLYGEEDYLKRQYKEKLKKALVDETDSMNLTIFEGKGIQINDVIGMAETMPFFAEKRLVLLENSGFFKSGGEELADYLKNASPTANLVFVESEIDKRSRLFKSVKTAGRVVEFPRQNEEILTTWILSRMKKEGKKITRPVLQQFLTAAGNDMEYMDKELEKLFCYTLDKEVIEEADVAAICAPPISNKIFDMVNAVAEKNQAKVLELYGDLLALKEPPMRILFLLARQFRILTAVKDLAEKGHGNKFIASQVSVPEFAVRRHLEQARRFSVERLMEAVADCVETEEAVKTGNLGDRMGVELLLIQYSR